MLTLGSVFPNFTVNSTEGVIEIPEYFGSSWGILFTHPADFTPVCTTELAKVIKITPELTKRNVKIVGISCDSIENHKAWEKDIQHLSGCEAQKFPFPIIADVNCELVTKLGMLDPTTRTPSGIPLPARAVYFLDPLKIVRAGILYPSSSGRNFDEVIRLVDSLQLTANTGTFTPADWHVGDAVIIPPNLPLEDAQSKFKGNVEICPLPSGKEYLRYTYI